MPSAGIRDKTRIAGREQKLEEREAALFVSYVKHQNLTITTFGYCSYEKCFHDGFWLFSTLKYRVKITAK